MEKTGKPVAGGIINIVAGVLNILGFIGVIIGIIVFGYFMVSSAWGPGPVPEFGPWMVPGFVETILWIVAVFLLVTGVLPIVGGIYALQRKKWGLALAGSIVAIFGSTLLGIAATVLVVLAKDEFE